MKRSIERFQRSAKHVKKPESDFRRRMRVHWLFRKLMRKAFEEYIPMMVDMAYAETPFQTFLKQVRENNAR